MLKFFKKSEDQNPDSVENWSKCVAENRSFGMTEAFKRLRTNVMFSFTDDSECRVIGVTSSAMHEGKSTVSINLAYDLLQAGKKVLLIDADMRLSQFAKRLGVEQEPGLSNFLVGENVGDGLFQQSDVLDGLTMIVCGSIPPNPTELLASRRMERLVEALKKAYQYIIIDLPPISQVADALIVSRMTDGIIVVVRQDFADKRLLDDTIHQLKYHDANLIGFVITSSESESSYYKHKYKYKYGKGYYSSCEQAGESHK